MTPQHKLSSPLDILLVEDNPFDAHLAEVALQETGIEFRLSIAQDGEAALDRLYQRAGFKGVQRPDIILLDLNLPGKSGIEVLADLKTNPDLRNIPTIMLTTSQTEEDIVRSYDLHANCFITKPTDVNIFIEVMRSITAFWIDVVILPKKTA